MLVLCRKTNETILIRWPGSTEVVEITLVRSWPDKARIGITAPRSVVVLRKEVADRQLVDDTGISQTEQ